MATKKTKRKFNFGEREEERKPSQELDLYLTAAELSPSTREVLTSISVSTLSNS